MTIQNTPHGERNFDYNNEPEQAEVTDDHGPDSLESILASYDGVGYTHIKDELNKLESCFERYKPNDSLIKQTTFLLSESELNEISQIRSIEDLTEKVKSRIDVSQSQNEQYLDLASFLNKVIYFQYKINIQSEVNAPRSKLTKKYLLLLDNSYLLSKAIIDKGIFKKFGRFGNPSIKRSS